MKINLKLDDAIAEAVSHVTTLPIENTLVNLMLAFLKKHQDLLSQIKKTPAEEYLFNALKTSDFKMDVWQIMSIKEAD